MSTKDATDMPPLPPAVGAQVQRGVRPVAYLYQDASVPEDAHPWLHSTLLVLAADRRPGLRGETALVTMAQAEAMVAAELERCVAVVRYWLAGHAPSEGSYEARCIAHLLDGMPASAWAERA